MYVPWAAINNLYPAIAIYAGGVGRKRKQLSEEEARVGVEMSLRAYVHPLETVTYFKYLVRLINATDNGWTEVIVKPQKARKSWYHLSRIFVREGSDPGMSNRFYLAVVQTVLLFGKATWVMTLRIGRLLGIFHHRVVRSLAGMQTKIWMNMILV